MLNHKDQCECPFCAVERLDAKLAKSFDRHKRLRQYKAKAQQTRAARREAAKRAKIGWAP